MAAVSEITEGGIPKRNETQDTQMLLRSMLDELRNIGVCLARQDGQVDRLNRMMIEPNVSTAGPASRLEVTPFSQAAAHILVQDHAITAELRAGVILEEALKRYKHNAVPFWSCLYGALMQSSAPQSPEEVIRQEEWSSVVAGLWRIPHDNRINLCFGAQLGDSSAVVRVQNFLSRLHIPERSNSPKGECFNIWDWFDTGISAYWYPGIQAAEIPLESAHRSTEKGLCNGSGYRLSYMVAPWRRIINFQGLTSLSLSKSTRCHDDLTDQDLCPFLLETKESIFQEPMDEVLWRVVKCHLRCLRVSEAEHMAMQTKDWATFHVTFYEILQVNSSNNPTDLWPSGELHSDNQQQKKPPRKIRESALTIIAIPSVDLPAPKVRAVFWTMICMRPNQFPHLNYSENRDDLARGCTHEMLDDMSSLVHQSLLIIIRKWEEIADYFDGLLVEKNGLLHPEYHDSLLTDDGAFTRSKRYFWAIEFLKQAQYSVSDNINQAERFIELLTTNPPATKMARSAFAMRLKKHETSLQKLEALRKRFRHKQDEAKALRDGLFSASAVIESRAATQLGENIQLLTYVSIFFLPLSFCTSLWSISDSIFSLSSLATILPIVALSTYVIVLNLHNIARLFRPNPASPTSSFLSPFRASLIRKMQNDPSRVWQERGTAFECARVARGASGCPSQWRLVQFAFRQLSLAVQRACRTLGAAMRQRVSSWVRRRRLARERRRFLPVSLAQLHDVRVQVQVDVDVETTKPEPVVCRLGKGEEEEDW